MNFLHRFFLLPVDLKKMLIKAYICMWVVQISLWIFPLPKSQKIIRFLSKNDRKNDPIEIGGVKYRERVIWAVMVGSNFVPKAKCLTRTLTAYILLKRRNFPVVPKIGVLKSDGNFKAHAWLESEGEVLMGITNSKYQVLDFKW
ncbi:MAG: hypothetical protein A4E25_00627 [Methanobacterium sp. PtaB.Bin024]|nr:MAG: hypothetical protein A4E25_00627 [Methanobacterium sp. PtaB.Bin024]